MSLISRKTFSLEKRFDSDVFFWIQILLNILAVNLIHSETSLGCVLGDYNDQTTDRHFSYITQRPELVINLALLMQDKRVLKFSPRGTVL